ncbi:MAG: hypothetical protein NZ894_04535 [Archaeoglobaceae archaeon]|nr:hypothetical protein [Archaeoglobaceae archaeon]
MRMKWFVNLLVLGFVIFAPVMASERSERGNAVVDQVKIAGTGAKETFVEKKEKFMRWNMECERWMGRLRQMVENSNISEDVKLKMQERINNVERQMEEVKKKVANSKDIEELRSVIMDIRKNVSKEMRFLAHQTAIERAREIIERLYELEDRFKSVGLDVLVLRNAIDEANATLNVIEEKFGKGEDISGDFKELKLELNKAFAEAKKLVRKWIEMRQDQRTEDLLAGV